MTPLYKQFNQVESQIAPNEARIAGFQHEIENLRKSNDAERNRISNDKLELITTEAEIKDLRNRLQLAEERKAFLEASIVEATQQIAENTQAIDDAMASIADLEKTIKELRDKADALRAKTTSLEVMVERIRDDVNVAQKKADAINEKIAEYKDQIAAQEKLLVTDDLKLLQDQIVVLKKIQITVEEEVNRQYFYCYGDGAFTIEKTGTVTVYIIRGEAFEALLENTYGISFDDVVCCTDKEGSSPKANVPSEIKMQSVDIFGDDYIDTNGNPVDDIIADTGKHGSPSNDVTDYTGPFECIVQEGVSGRGVIVDVAGNRYTVRRYANAGPPLDDFVEVAPCTIIMSTVKVPRAGMSMAFTGASAAGFYQANMITVW